MLYKILLFSVKHQHESAIVYLYPLPLDPLSHLASKQLVKSKLYTFIKPLNYSSSIICGLFMKSCFCEQVVKQAQGRL